MESSKRIVHLFVLLAFAAIFVRGRDWVRHNLSKETGLTPSCVKRVLATCATSTTSSLHAERNNCDADETNTLRRALEELSTGQRDLHHFLREWLGTSKVQEQSLLEVKSDVQALKEVALQSLTTRESSKNQEESLLLKEVKVQRLLLEDLVKTTALHDSIVSEMQKSLSKTQAHSDLQSMEKLREEIAKQGASLSEIEEILRKKNQSASLLPQTTTSPNLDFTPKNCADLLKHGDNETGIQTVYPFFCNKNRSLAVLCDQKTDKGGWTVFQLRDALPQRENFFRKWVDYQDGFGDLTGEFWLGLENIYAFVSGTPMELRVDLEDFEGEKRWAKYEVFSIEDAAEKYRLHLEGYSGDAGDSLMKRHSGMVFSTKDQDNDNWNKHCAQVRRGGWWYDDCTSSNLNGFPHQGKYESSDLEGIYWYEFRGNKYSLKKTSMKMRPKLRK